MHFFTGCMRQFVHVYTYMPAKGYVTVAGNDAGASLPSSILHVSFTC